MEETIDFNKKKSQIEAALEHKLSNVPFPGEDNGFTIIEGFFNMPLQTEIGGGMVIGGPTIPMVGLVGNKTGRIYYFAYKALVTE